jgi:hypothetical protein
MTLDEFSETTQYIISKEGFDYYLPTACYPARREIKVLTGLPSHVDPEKPVLDWAAKSAEINEEFLVAFKIDGDRFKIIRRVGPFSEDEIYTVSR